MYIKPLKPLILFCFISLFIIIFNIDIFNKNDVLFKLENTKENSNFTKKVLEIKTKSKLKAWLIKDSTNPIIALNIIFKTGSVNDNVKKLGITNMVASLLDEGAGKLKSKDFQETLKTNAIDLSFEGNDEVFSIYLQTLKENKKLAFNLLKKALFEPRFDEEPISRVKQQILISIKRQKESPYIMASKALKKHIFKEHSYSYELTGTPKTIQNITKKDLINYVNTRFTKNNIFIGASGDIEPEELSSLIDNTLSPLKEHAKHNNTSDTSANFDGKTIKTTMNVPQTLALFSQKSVSRNDKDFYPLYILNHILGGGSFSSRLMKEVRVKNGYAYSINTGLDLLEKAPILIGSVATNSKDFEKSKTIILQQWEKTKEHGVTKQELIEAKKYLIGSFPLRFGSTPSLAIMLAGMQYHNLKIDFLQKRNQIIKNVSLKQINKVAKKHLTPNKIVFSIVGK